MANFIYNEAKRALANKELDLDTDTLKLALVMTNTTADTEKNPNFMNGFSTLDEYDGTPYTRQTVATSALAEDAGNNRTELPASASTTFSTLGSSIEGTRNVQGAILYKHVTDDTDSIPIAWIDTGGFPFDDNGGDVTVAWSAEGILQVT